MKQAFVNMAMMNYPYESNFIKNLPAWPVQAACSSFKGLMKNLKKRQKFIMEKINV